MNFSITYVSAIVFIIVWLLKGAGVVVPEDQITSFVATGVQIVTALGILWGRFRQGDINVFGKKVS